MASSIGAGRDGARPPGLLQEDPAVEQRHGAVVGAVGVGGRGDADRHGLARLYGDRALERLGQTVQGGVVTGCPAALSTWCCGCDVWLIELIGTGVDVTGTSAQFCPSTSTGVCLRFG